MRKKDELLLEACKTGNIDLVNTILKKCFSEMACIAQAYWLECSSTQVH
jgi:hypothetical protein